HLECQDLLAAGHVPELQGPAILGRAGQAFAIGAEGHAKDSVRVSLEGPDLLAAFRVPQLHRPVKTGRGQEFTVGTESHAPDSNSVPLEGQNFPAVGHVPQFHLARRPDDACFSSFAAASRGQAIAVWTKGKASHEIGVPPEDPDQLAAGSVPQLHRALWVSLE